jgi:glycosyltransferase involved in cell wall biosynthesis
MRHEVKDYPMFLRAAKRVRNEILNAEFLLAGEGELMPELKLMAQDLGLADSAHFLGRCEAIAELLHASDVCVLTSKAEGFSNSILEYMAAGRPVIATDVGGASEAITEGRTGYLVPAGNDELMAARIIAVLKNSDISSMGNTGRQIVAEKFSLEAQLARTEELYERLISGTGVSPV